MSPSDIVQRLFTRGSPHGTQSLGWSSIQATDQGSLVSSTSFARNIPPAPPSSESYATSSVAGGGLPPESTATKRSPVRPDSTALPTPLARAYDAKELPATPPGEGPAFSLDGNNNNNNKPAASRYHPRGDSDVSAFSERERSHLRQLSDPATVSTMDAVIAPTNVAAAAANRSHTAQQGGGRVGSPPILEEGAVAAANAGAAHQDVVSPPTGSEAEGEDYVGARMAPGPVSPVNVRSEPPAASVRRSAFRESDEDLGGGGGGRR